jgi:hypothetical protein
LRRRKRGFKAVGELALFDGDRREIGDTAPFQRARFAPDKVRQGTDYR